MKRILLLTFSFAFISFVQAQKKAKPVTAYAITGVQKGNTSWTEVRLVDVNTGEELQTIYSSASEAEILNARTGKPVAKRDATASTLLATQTLEPLTQVIKKEGGNTVVFTRKI